MQVQDLALGLSEPREARTGPPLQLVWVSLDNIPSFWHVDPTARFHVICKRAEDVLNLSMPLMNVLKSTGPSTDR